MCELSFLVLRREPERRDAPFRSGSAEVTCPTRSARMDLQRKLKPVCRSVVRVQDAARHPRIPAPRALDSQARMRGSVSRISSFTTQVPNSAANPRVLDHRVHDTAPRVGNFALQSTAPRLGLGARKRRWATSRFRSTAPRLG